MLIIKHPHKTSKISHCLSKGKKQQFEVAAIINPYHPGTPVVILKPCISLISSFKACNKCINNETICNDIEISI